MHLLFKNEFCVCQRAACLGVAVPGVSMAHSAAMRRDADHRNGVDMGRLAAGGESPAAPLAPTRRKIVWSHVCYWDCCGVGAPRGSLALSEETVFVTFVTNARRPNEMIGDTTYMREGVGCQYTHAGAI